MLLCRFPAILLFCLGVCACLPGDTRPPPGTLLVTATSAAAADQAPGWLTEDGWSILYERFLVSLGGANLFGGPNPSGPPCETYSEGADSRILDMLVPGPQKVSLHFALGQCLFGFSLVNAWPDSVLGQGVTEDDRSLMSSPGSPREIGVSLFVQGTASRGDVRKTFAWSFRQPVGFSECTNEPGGGRGQGITLRQEEAKTFDLRLHGEALFYDKVDPAEATLRFDAFADADGTFGNDDGSITVDEFARVELAPLQVMDRYREVRPGDRPGPVAPAWRTFGEYVHVGALPNIVRVEGGQCTLHPGPSQRR